MITHNILGDAAAGTVAFSAPYPGKILTMALKNSAILCQRAAFLCATGDITINVEFTKRLGAGFFGGEGFISERYKGDREEVKRDLGGALGAIGDLIGGDS